MNKYLPLPTESQLRQALKAMLDAAVDGVILIDHAGIIREFNQAAERLFGYSAAEVLGCNVSVLMPEPERSQHDAYLASYAETRIPNVIGRGREVTAQRKDGSVFPAWLSVGQVRDAEPPCYVGFVHDMSERRQTEEAGRRLQDRLMHVSRLATVGEMSTGIAHELNQPLTAIANYAQACERLLALPDADIPEIQSALREIGSQAVRAGDIIRRLRSLARTPSSQRERTDINQLVQELTLLIQSETQRHGVEYLLELGPDLPEVMAEREQIQQVVLNLIRNAVEALAHLSGTGRRVTLRTLATTEGEVGIQVCDNGPGIPAHVAERLFDAFHTTKADGTGLGLAMSRTIAHSHRGQLEYRRNQPTGACFVLSLPAIGVLES